MSIYWRTAALDDVNQLAAMNGQLIEDETGGAAPDIAKLRLQLHGWLQGQRMRGAVFFSTRQSEAASAVAYALWQERGTDVLLRHFFVAREQRRAGIGRAAIGLMEREILPGTLIRLEVLATNERGRRFWAAMGYAPFSLTLEKHPDQGGTMAAEEVSPPAAP